MLPVLVLGGYYDFVLLVVLHSVVARRAATDEGVRWVVRREGGEAVFFFRRRVCLLVYSIAITCPWHHGMTRLSSSDFVFVVTDKPVSSFRSGLSF